MANQMCMVFSKLNCRPRWRERLRELAIPTLVVHARRAGRTLWLNPEPKHKPYWNYGDSVMAAYEPYCDGALEC